MMMILMKYIDGNDDDIFGDDDNGGGEKGQSVAFHIDHKSKTPTPFMTLCSHIRMSNFRANPIIF